MRESRKSEQLRWPHHPNTGCPAVASRAATNRLGGDAPCSTRNPPADLSLLNTDIATAPQNSIKHLLPSEAQDLYHLEKAIKVSFYGFLKEKNTLCITTYLIKFDLNAKQFHKLLKYFTLH